MEVRPKVTKVSADPAEPPGSARLADRTGTRDPLERPGPPGPIERVMSTVIRRLSWSRLSDPKIAIALSGVGLLLGMLVGAMAPNTETLPYPIVLPLSHLLPSLQNYRVLASVMLYTGDVLACLGLAGMLWAHSQGWRPDPRRLLLASAGIVAVMVSLTPVGSSDTASYAAYGRIAALGGNPYTTNPQQYLGLSSPYTTAVGSIWKTTPSVYGPVATVIQKFAATIGGANASTTIWILMILNGIVFIGVGLLLLKTSDDPIRATLFWTANPVMIQQLVSGGHLDTFVAAAAICSIQVARRVSGMWGDVLIGVLIGLACGVKINAVLIGDRAGVAAAAAARVAAHGQDRAGGAGHGRVGVQLLRPDRAEAALRGLEAGHAAVAVVVRARDRRCRFDPGVDATLIGILWPIAMIVVAGLIYRRISSDQPREVVAPFALTFAWIVVAPWVFAWYTAIAWVTLTQVPRNRMTRWLTIVTVLLALWHSSGGQVAPGQ